jgi:hypothetical protein
VVAGASVVVVGGSVVVVEGGDNVVVVAVDDVVVELDRGEPLLDVDEPHAPVVRSNTTANAGTRERGDTTS